MVITSACDVVCMGAPFMTEYPKVNVKMINFSIRYRPNSIISMLLFYLSMSEMKLRKVGIKNEFCDFLVSISA